MSETVPQGRGGGQQAAALAAEGTGQRAAGEVTAVQGGRETAATPPRHGRFRWAVLGTVLVLAVGGAAAAWRAGAFSPKSSSATGQGAPAPNTYTVTRGDLASQTSVNATLGYSGSYSITGKGGGTLTSLPPVGKVIGQGEVLYRTDNGSPVILLYGSVPSWRTLDEGLTGADVDQLNHDLVRLGDANSADISSLGWDYYSWETTAGVENLQSALGISSPSGSLTLGSVVFEPTSVLVSNLMASLGGPASGPILAATSDQHVVTIPLSTSYESEVAAGDPVTVTLPNGATTPGTISSIGTVATGSGSNATIPVTVTFTHPSAAGTLDKAPVTVNITTAGASDVLAVPVTALLAQSSGGYDVEVVGPGNTRRYVPVQVGPIFDDTTGLVEVTGALTPGQRVVVPAT